MSYTPLPHWTPKIIDAMRVLFRYAVGHNSARTAVPNWQEFCASLEATPPEDEEERRQRIARYTDQLNHFKEGLNRLDFDNGATTPRLDYVRQQLFRFYGERQTARQEMFDYHKTVYSDRGLEVADIKVWLADIFGGAEPDDRAIKRMPGVYHLYRHGSFENGEPTIVRSAMLITRGALDRDQFLSFEISYPTTTERRANKTHRITGNILCVLNHYYFIGADSGSAKAPYLLVTKQHTEDAAPEDLSGLLMRHSHNTDMLAARILIVRVSADEDGQAPLSVHQKEYEAAVRAARVLSPNEKDTSLDERRRAKLVNAIDSMRAPVLWLMPNDEDLPEAPPEQPRPVRGRAGR